MQKVQNLPSVHDNRDYRVSSGVNKCYGCILFLILLGCGVHIAGYIYGLNWAADNRMEMQTSQSSLYTLNHNLYIDRWNKLNMLYEQEIRQEFYFMMVASGLIIFMCLILICNYCGCCQCLSAKARHWLLLFILLLVFAIAVVVALRTSHNSDINHDRAFPTWDDDYDNFKKFKRFTFWDTLVTFIIEFPLLLFLFSRSLNDVAFTEIITPIAVEVPPLSNRQF